MADDQILKYTTPEAEGISSLDLMEFYKQLDISAIEFHHVSIARHGNVISQGSWAPYKAEYPHMTHSLTKLFTNTALGIACDEGLVSLDDKVVSYFPEDIHGITDENVFLMTVRDLITMRCGHDHLISGNKWRPIKTSWVAEFFKEPVAYKPGEHFQYTSATSYIISAIVQKVTGKTTFEYLKEKLLNDMPIGEMSWDRCPHGICSGGNGISITNIDALKIGMLYLNDGIWNGKRYLSHQWIQEAMYDSCRLNPDTGYGFHLCNENGIISSGGIFGQTVVMIPKYDMVISINAANPGNRPNALDQRMRSLLEQYLFPIIQDHALSESPLHVQKLNSLLSGLSLPEPTTVKELLPKRIGLKHYTPIEQIDGITEFSLDFKEDQISFSMTDARGTHTVICGLHDWIYSESSMTGNYLHHQYQPDYTTVAGKAYITGPNTMVMKWAWVKMTFVDTVEFHFDDDRVTWKRSVNVNTQDTERPEIIGV